MEHEHPAVEHNRQAKTDRGLAAFWHTVDADGLRLVNMGYPQDRHDRGAMLLADGQLTDATKTRFWEVMATSHTRLFGRPTTFDTTRPRIIAAITEQLASRTKPTDPFAGLLGEPQ